MSSTSPSPDLTGRTALVTGATSGIGRAVAIALARRGARIIVPARSLPKAHAVVAALPTVPDGGGDHVVRELDLADLTSVASFAEATPEAIDLLVNNAGVASPILRRTADGHELQFGTNHLGHFALTSALLPRVTGRIVTVASQAERMSRLDVASLTAHHLDWHDRPYDASRAYADSKLANLLFTLELDRRLRAAGSTVRALAAHPGIVVTAIYDRRDGRRAGLWDRLLPIIGQSADAGALPVLMAATADLPGGTFTGPKHLLHMRGGAQVIGRSARARDGALAQALWTASEHLTGVRAPLPG
ncbi:SDR family NAD(P)-dependent oxidoreductase [Nocardioides hwasunensis]|uniref:SDR family NAD(P)-dependent oxidoreductase n=1 Tax=Nocardioides hwasunensis TaxID=397258 RepID=A0ABR8MF08_9ACTN|nr:SDR family NAD(P)-dependent oxidoreductase [Nocardioides hwasunensis]MBD3914682.1 SDR family NAD(P)-dependent oxidoreductase [Nocardioides hwasunensis]